MMNYVDFCETVKNMMVEMFTEFDIEDIRLEKVAHNNGVIHVGVVITEKGKNASPTFYMEEYYDAYIHGMEIEDICKDIADKYRNARKKIKMGNYDIGMEDLPEKVFLRLVNYERNKEMLADCPYIPYHDMAITFRYLVNMDENGVASTLLHDDNIKNCGMKSKELFETAARNTIEFFPPFSMKLDQFLAEKYSTEAPQGMCYPDIYIMTNKQFIYGASMMLYKNHIADLANELKKNLYIVPSSVNEILLCPDDEIEKEMIKATLLDVNREVVSDMDFLSDTLYYYDRTLDEIRVA